MELLIAMDARLVRSARKVDALDAVVGGSRIKGRAKGRGGLARKDGRDAADDHLHTSL